MTYTSGDHYVICDICGLRRRRSDCTKNWKNQMVCRDRCYEPKHPQLDIRITPDIISVEDPRPETWVDVIPDADADAICLSQTPTASGQLNMNGTLRYYDRILMDVCRPVSITSTANDSGRTFTIVGKDKGDHPQTETITGPNTTTVNGTSDFREVISVSVDGATAGAITVGTAEKADVRSSFLSPGDVTVDSL